MTHSNHPIRCGKIALFGRPNAGKSTFLNALLQETLSSISPRPQTTQAVIPGIYSREHTQFIFLDSPGFLTPKDPVQSLIRKEALKALRSAHVGIWIVDLTREKGDEDLEIEKLISQFFSFPVIKIATKPQKKEIRDDSEALRIDPNNDSHISDLLDRIEKLLPESPFEFSQDTYTSLSIESRVQEVIRGALFAHLGEEIPYDCHVSVEDVDNGQMLRLLVIITTNTDSQKIITIGTGGKTLQKIGTQSRQLLEKIYGKKVYLGLRVRSQKNWKLDERMLQTYFPNYAVR